MRRFLYTLSLLLFIILPLSYMGYYIYSQPALQNLFFPCTSPITYSIGTFDTNFGISKSSFSAAIEKAAAIWEKPLGKNLFAEGPRGELTINLIYDARQAATQKMAQLGITIHDSEESYNQVKAKYNTFLSAYAQQKTSLEALNADYEEKKATYERSVEYWNSRGGAPKKEYDTLDAERTTLNALAQQLNQAQVQLGDLVDNINALVQVMNQLASELNLNVGKYNTIGSSQGQEFEEGIYTSNGLTRKIDIYQFDNQDKLLRVLAHELGHALGLLHLNDPQAIMYRLNQATNKALTADDLAALKERCGME